jgi:hypothetical protein
MTFVNSLFIIISFPSDLHMFVSSMCQLVRHPDFLWERFPLHCFIISFVAFWQNFVQARLKGWENFVCLLLNAGRPT